MNNERAFNLTVIIVAAVVGGLLLLAFTLWQWPANAGDLGRQWAQANGLSDAEKQWFKDQLVPGGASKSASCCSDADGTYAEEEIRNGRYWTRFQYKKRDTTTSSYVDVVSDWMAVPPEVVLPTNHHGAPVVWWWMPGSKLMIRCYAPGSGA